MPCTVTVLASANLDFHVWRPEEAAEVTCFFAYAAGDVSRYGPKLRHLDVEAIPLPSVFPNSSSAAVYENHRGDPSLRAIDFRLVLHSHEVLPLLMAEEKRIEVRQEAG